MYINKRIYYRYLDVFKACHMDGPWRIIQPNPLGPGFTPPIQLEGFHHRFPCLSAVQNTDVFHLARNQRLQRWTRPGWHRLPWIPDWFKLLDPYIWLIVVTMYNWVVVHTLYLQQIVRLLVTAPMLWSSSWAESFRGGLNILQVFGICADGFCETNTWIVFFLGWDKILRIWVDNLLQGLIYTSTS